MESALDFYFVNEYSDAGIVLPPSFVYDEGRYCSKVYVFLKLMGLITYITTLTKCYNQKFYTTMIVFMFISTLNSLRYEHKHLQRYGTTFSSIHEYRVWKRGLWPRSRLIFSMIELGIKVWYFINTFPPNFEFNNICNIGDSIFKIHILVLFATYILIAFIVICLFSTTLCNAYTHYNSTNIQNQNILLPVVNLNPMSVAIPVAIAVTIPIPILVTGNHNDECCICLDNNKEQTWSILPCGHKFHDSCISLWLLRQQKCPVCRHDMVNSS
jgi:hypothetical protein